MHAVMQIVAIQYMAFHCVQSTKACSFKTTGFVLRLHKDSYVSRGGLRTMRCRFIVALLSLSSKQESCEGHECRGMGRRGSK